MQNIIVIPCFNEGSRLKPEVFCDFLENHHDICFLFVDDGSIDNTLKILHEMTFSSSQIFCTRLEKNSGKAEAVRYGMMYAYENFKSEYIGFWDADLATPLNEIDNFILQAQRNNLEVVTGLRLMRLGSKVDRKISRHYLGRLFATVTSWILNLPVYDTQCGAKLYRTSVVPCLFREPFLTRWLFDVELLARYIMNYGKNNAIIKIYEYPVYEWVDIDGSKLKVKDFLKAPVELYKIKRKYLTKNKIGLYIK